MKNKHRIRFSPNVLRLKPKFVLEAEKAASRKAEERLDGTRFVWFCIGLAVAYATVIAACIGG